MSSPFSGEIGSADCTLMNVNYVTGLIKNLLSVPKATTAGTLVIFNEDAVIFCKERIAVPDGIIILKGVKRSNVYNVDLNCKLTVNKTAL